MFQEVIKKLEAEQSQSINLRTPKGDEIAEVAAAALRVLNVNGDELIEHIFKPAFEAYTFEVLAEVAGDYRVESEISLYGELESLFYRLRTLRNSLSPHVFDELDKFFASNIGKNL